MSELKDWRGTPIVVGSVIVYPGTAGSSLWVTEASVLEVNERTKFSGTVLYSLKVQRLRRNGHWGRASDGVSRLERVDLVTVVG